VVVVGGSVVVVVGGSVVVVVGGSVVVVVGGSVVVVVGGSVVVVVGGSVVVVVVLFGWVVVVVVDLLPPEVFADFVVVGKVQVAAAQSCGWEATTTSTPGKVLKDQTLSGVPVSRQASAGSLVVSWLNVPKYCGVPSEAGVTIAVRETALPFHTPVVT
jgi:hypothetical protein